MRFTEKTFFWLALILTAFVRLRLADIAMERDEGEYAYAGWQILMGKLPYLDFYNMKFPGVYYAYAGIFSVAGYSIIAVRIAVLIMNLLSAFFLFKIAEKRIPNHPITQSPNHLITQSPNYLTAGFYLLLSISFGVQGFIANSEQFVLFFALGGLWLLSNRYLFFSGIALAGSVLMKQQGLVFAAFAVFTILEEGFNGMPKLLIVKRLAIFSIGFLLPLWGLIQFVIAKGIFDDFYFYTVQYAAAYSSIIQPTLRYISTFIYVVIDSPVLWLLFFMGIYKIIRTGFVQKKWRDIIKTPLIRAEFGLILLWIFSFLSVCAGWYFRQHYWQLLLPATALLLTYSWNLLDFRFFKRSFSAETMLKTIVATTAIFQFCYFFYYSPDHVSRRMYPLDYCADIKRFSLFLKTQVQPDERIGQYGCEPQIWFYTQREAASGFLYAYPLMEAQPFAESMTAQFIKETEQTNPEWLIHSYFSISDDNPKTTQQLDAWMKKYTKNYQLKGYLYETTHSEADWKWDVGDLDIDTIKPLMAVYKRK